LSSLQDQLNNSMLRLSITVLALAALGHCKLTPCHSSDIYKPCECYVNSVNDLEYITCKNIHNETSFDDIFSRDLPNRNFGGLIIMASDLPSLSNVFNGTSFRDIKINELGQLTHVSSDVFNDSKETLESIEFKFTPQLSPLEVPFEEFAKFSKRVSITLQGLRQGTGLPIIKDENFGQVKMFEFDIGLPLPEGFMQDSAASSISLSQLELHALPKGSFTVKSPMNITLSENTISRIEDGAFVVDTQNGLADGGVNINLCSNHMQIINEDVWGGVFPLLDSFHVCDNPLMCDCDLAWIYRNQDYRTMFIHSLVTAPYPTTCITGRVLASLTAQDFQHCPAS